MIIIDGGSVVGESICEITTVVEMYRGVKPFNKTSRVVRKDTASNFQMKYFFD